MTLWRRLAVLALVALAGSFASAAPASNDDEGAHEVLVLLKMPPAHYRPDGAYSGSYGDGIGRSARRRVASQLAQAHGLKLVTDWPMPLIGVDCYVMAAPADGSPERIAESLSGDARVAWAQPMNLYRAQGAPDPLLSVQPAAEQWHLGALHAVATGKHVKVAVVDSAVDERHPDLLGQVETQRNFVDKPLKPEQHGTAVAGVIAAREGNGVGIAGIAPDARLLALRACWQRSDQDSVCNTLSLAQALHFAISSDAQVINLSLAGPDDRLLGQLVDLAVARGISVVGAADRRLPQGGFPAMHAGVIAVVEQGEAPPPGTIAAPGRDVPTTTPGGRWQLLSGSSFAAAHVSGLLALAHELDSGAQALPAALTSGTRAPGPRIRLVPDASGSVDACATLRAMNACACGCRSASADAGTSTARP